MNFNVVDGPHNSHSWRVAQPLALLLDSVKFFTGVSPKLRLGVVLATHGVRWLARFATSSRTTFAGESHLFLATNRTTFAGESRHGVAGKAQSGNWCSWWFGRRFGSVATI